MEYEKIAENVDRFFDDWELFFLKERVKKFECREKEIYGVDINEEEGIALRGLKDQRMVFSYSFEKGGDAIEDLLKNSRTLLPFMDEDEDFHFPDPTGECPSLSIYDSDGLRTDDNHKISLLLEMEKAIIDYDMRIVATRSCELQESEIHTRIINSRGLLVEDKKTLYTLFALAVAKDKDEASWYDWSWSPSLNEIDHKGLGLSIAEKTISFLSSVQIDTGIYEGILTSRAASDILDIAIQSFLGENLYKDKTRLKDRVGERLFSGNISISDTGMVGPSAFPFDGEGVPSQENIIVDKGILKGFLHDSYYGRKFGVLSTSNSVRRGVKDPPRCAPRGTFIKAGERDIASSTQKGIVIEDLMGAHTANTITGDFSLGASGFLWRNGKKEPFNGVIFSGNVFEILNGVQETGNDLRFHGSVGAPPLYVDSLKISGL